MTITRLPCTLEEEFPAQRRGSRLEEPAEEVPIISLRAADSLRLGGENLEHIRLLAELDDDLPPILVQRSTMRVIDGMHRLGAAALHGRSTIRVRYFDGDEDASFLRSVRENVSHGLPLSLADREAAAARIIRSHPNWSDRAIGSTAKLSDKTVAAIRRLIDGSPADSGVRVGRDGRRRPLNSAERRRVAGELIAANPEASLRQVARAAGISPTTVRKVRDQIRNVQPDQPEATEDPITVSTVPALPSEDGETCVGPNLTVAQVIHTLHRDPSLRMSEVGRALLRRVTVVAMGPQGLVDFVSQVQPHSLYLLTDLARACAGSWEDFARSLEQHLKSNT